MKQFEMDAEDRNLTLRRFEVELANMNKVLEAMSLATETIESFVERMGERIMVERGPKEPDKDVEGFLGELMSKNRGFEELLERLENAGSALDRLY